MHSCLRCLTPILAAVFCLGTFTANAQDEPSADKIAEWRRGAEQGNAEAQFNLGTYYDDKRTVEDKVEAAKWYRKAAEQGHAQAQNFIGSCYSDGIGVVMDKVEAAKWCRKAAEQGDADAQYWIGIYYSKGQGVVKDNVEAYKWWNLAAASGNNYASKLRESIEKRMTPDQIAEAQRLSREWKPNK
jgi:hypothetical protein